MKPILFPNNDNEMMFEYHRMREGPNYFLCYYKQSSVLRQDPKDAWRVLGPAKFTSTGKELKEWCVEQHELYSTVCMGSEGNVDTSFASDVEVEPNENTKMVV